MDFGNILTRAWQISWKHKALWLFGILAACGGSIIGALITLPIIFVAVPVLFAAITGTAGLIGSGLAISGICLIVGIPIVILLNGILRTFLEGAWTLTYKELADESETA